MNRRIFTLLLLLPIFSCGQTSYTATDQYVSNLEVKTSDTWKMAQQITAPFQDDEEKVRAIYAWVANHIDYDCKLFKDKVKRKKLARKKLKKRLNYTLRRHSAICGGYAELFQILCKATGVECKIVVGYSKADEKSIGTYQRADHAWNVVKIQGDWKLVDVTWGSGYVEKDTFYQAFNEDYFLTDPDKFIFNHLPTNPQWRLTAREVNRTAFHDFPLVHGGYFAGALELMPASLNGIIEVEPDETFQIKFESINKVQSIHIVQGRKGNLKSLVFQEKDKVYSADLCFRKKGSHFVTIVVDFKPVWTYRVIVK